MTDEGFAGCSVLGFIPKEDDDDKVYPDEVDDADGEEHDQNQSPSHSPMGTPA